MFFNPRHRVLIVSKNILCSAMLFLANQDMMGKTARKFNPIDDFFMHYVPCEDYRMSGFLFSNRCMLYNVVRF